MPLPLHYQTPIGATGSQVYQGSQGSVKPIPSPSKQDLENPIFEPIFQVIKDWDIRIPGHYGSASGNGSHVKMIMDALIPIIRDQKIEEILK
jgi:hypothetical protein